MDLNTITEAIIAGRLDLAVSATKEAIAEGTDAQEIINGYMVKGMEEIGLRFENGKAFVPNLLLAARAMKGALDLLKPMMKQEDAPSAGKIVIGTVKGDLHDIGKNLVASMLEGCGFEVINLGSDVSAEKFVDAARSSGAQIVAMSALLTTTMTYMPKVIEAFEAAGLRDKVKIMIGGAPITQAYADKIGADGYSANANAAVTVARMLVAA